MGRSGESARTALLDAAERLFAQQGIEGVSLRDVAAAAGQRNHSAAQYHFGDRVGLVAAVYERRQTPINDKRWSMLRELDRQGRGLDPLGLAEASMIPLAEHVGADPDGYFGRFLLRVRWHPEGRAATAQSIPLLAVRELRDRLDTVLADLSPAVRRWRRMQLQTHLVAAVADWEELRDARRLRPSAEELVEDLVRTGHSIITAPASVPTVLAKGAER